MDKTGAVKINFLETFNKAKSKQLNELRKENEFCDLTLKCEDGFEIKVHRVVVCAASNYFKHLLTLPIREKYKESISLPDITGDILEKIITFIYTTEIEEKIEDVEKIIKYAAIFQLQELIEICLLTLNKFINDRTSVKFGASEDLVLATAELLNKVAKLPKQEFEDEPPSRLIFHKPTQPRLIGLAQNRMLIDLGEGSTIEKEKKLGHLFGYTTFDNELLICGGENSNSCEYFEPNSEEWKKFPSLKTKKWPQCSYLDNKIYACGGKDTNTVEVFDLGKGEWDYGPEMLANNFNFGLTEINGAIYAIGGETKNVEILDPRTQKWKVACSNFDCVRVRCVSIGACIYCFSSQKRHIFDTRSNKFSEEICSENFKDNLNLCELDGYIYGLGFRSDPANKYSLNFVQYHLDGSIRFKKFYGLYDSTELNTPAIVSLYF